MAKSVVFAVIFCAACAAQTPAAKASLEGHVVSVTGEPLKNATLRLQADRHPGPPVPPGQRPLPLPVYTTTSDAAGNFAFEAVDPAIYTLSAQRTGYLAQQYSTATGYFFTLAAGQPTTGVSVKMTPEARIEGKITNEDGEPFGNAPVVVSFWGTSGNGLKQLIISRGDSIATTAADGSYVIGGLRAGHYFVSTTAQTYRPSIRYDDVPRERYINTYYPAAPNAAEANAIAVAPGAVVRGIDIQLRKVTSYRVRGKVVTGAPDGPITNLQIRMTPEDNLGFGPAGATVREDGTFEVNGAIPDTYILQALPLFPVRSGTQPPPLFAYERIVVGKEDIEDLVLRLAPGVEVDGHLKIESNGQQTAAPATFPTVNLIPAVSNTIATRAESSGNGANFVFRNLAPDKYLPQILGTLPPGTYLKSIRWGAQDVTGKRIDLTSGAGGTLEIVLSPHAAAVSGILRNSNGDPLPQIPLTLWAQGFAPESDLTDASGVFRFTNLPPGEYRVAAWDQLGLPPPAIPEFLSQFENTAATVKLDEDSQQTIEVPVIKSDAIDAAMVNVR